MNKRPTQGGGIFPGARPNVSRANVAQSHPQGLRYDEAYFAGLRQQEAPFWERIRKIPTEGYRTVQQAATAALQRIWYRSLLEEVEWGGLLYKKKEGFGIVAPVTVNLGFAVVIPFRGPEGATFQGAYHTHVNVPGSSPEQHSGKDKAEAKKTGAPVYVSNPDRQIIEFHPSTGAKRIGVVEELPLGEVYQDDNPPDFELRRLLEAHRQWRLSQLPGEREKK
jgi:hypothetical protein